MEAVTPGTSPLSAGRTAGAALLVLVCTAVGRVVGATAAATLGPSTVPPETDGLLVGAAILTASLLGGAALFLVVRGRDPKGYLAIVRPSASAVLVALGASALLVVAFDAARWATTGTVIPASWLAVYR